jgi:hypothetical protein
VEPSSKRRFKKGTNPYSRMTPGPDTSATFFAAEMTRVAFLSGGVVNFRLEAASGPGNGLPNAQKAIRRVSRSHDPDITNYQQPLRPLDRSPPAVQSSSLGLQEWFGRWCEGPNGAVSPIKRAPAHPPKRKIRR